MKIKELSKIQDTASVVRTNRSGEYSEEVVNALMSALADEINAWYQYWIVSQFITGIPSERVKNVFEWNANDELNDHAYNLKVRIYELGGNVANADSPLKLLSLGKCAYIAPEYPYEFSRLVLDNIASEQCAIETYNSILCIESLDTVTRNMIEDFLKDEQEHLVRLQGIADDFKIIY